MSATCIASGQAVDVIIMGEIVCPACKRLFSIPRDCAWVAVLPVHEPSPNPRSQEASK